MRKDSTDDSRREFMKKGTLAATALAVGAGAASTSATAQEEQGDGEAVIHGHDYYPDGEFTVLAQLETLSRTDLLEHLDEDEAVFDDPDNWEVYVIGIEAGEAGPLGHLMVENDEVSPSPGDTGTMGETASIRDSGLNLLELDVTLEEVDEEVDDDEDEEVDDEVDDDEVDDEEVDDDEDEEVEDDEDNEEVDDEEDDDGLFD